MTQTPHLTANQRMADAVLKGKGTTLENFLADRYKQGLSYETIGRDLHVFTDGVVSPSYQTIRRWLLDLGLLKVEAS